MVVAVESSHEHRDSPKVLARFYTEASWKVPLVNKLSAVSQNSFEKWSVSHSKREIPRANAPEQALSHDTVARTRANFKAQLTFSRRSVAARKNSGDQCGLEIASIDEDPLEARWDSFGRVLPTRRNILGERYASHQERFLQYTERYTATEIFARMKKIVREDLRTRETRRIQALNRKQAELDELWAEAREKELESRFDNQFK